MINSSRSSNAALTTVLCAILFTATRALATPVAITNPSFEDPATNRNGTGSIPGWTRSDLTDGASGIWRPQLPTDFGSVPDGLQVAYVQAGYLSQTLPAVLTANTLYELNVYVGEADREQSLGPDEYAVQLLAGGIVLAQSTSPDPLPGAFVTSIVTYTATPTDPLLGQNLEIRLVDFFPSFLDGDPHFDNVSLQATSVAEPSVVCFLLSTACCLIPRRWRKLCDRCGRTD